MAENPTLLAITELGGYPDFSALYREMGYRVLEARSMRKAIGLLKREDPALIVAEFNFQSDFRDRTSNLESLLATLQGRHSQARILVFYEPEYQDAFARLRSRWQIHAALPFPVTAEAVRAALAALEAA